MVQPIRPVSWFSALCARPLIVCRRALLRGHGFCAGRANLCNPTLATIVRGKAMGLAICRGLLGVKCATPETLSDPRPVADNAADQVISIEPWKPWPAHPPFIDEVRRWWPSQDWPPPDPPIVIQEASSSGPPYLIIWAPPGRVIDLWA